MSSLSIRSMSRRYYWPDTAEDAEIIDDLWQEEKRPLVSSGAVEKLCKSLADLDDLIGNSIVTARVHRNVCTRLEADRRRREQ